MDIARISYIYGLINSSYFLLVMSKIFETIKQTVANIEADVEKFTAGNNAAGGRVRKAMQDLKNLAQDLRKEVLDVKNSRTGK